MFTTAIFLHFFYFFFNDTATTEIYTLSLHDALPIWPRDFEIARRLRLEVVVGDVEDFRVGDLEFLGQDRKSTRLNSSHPSISYAVFCLKKKNQHPLECRRHPIHLVCPQRRSNRAPRR